MAFLALINNYRIIISVFSHLPKITNSAADEVVDPYLRRLNVRNMLMCLRRITMHSYLLEFPYDKLKQEYIIDERLISSSGKLLVLDRLLSGLKPLGHKVCVHT